VGPELPWTRKANVVLSVELKACGGSSVREWHATWVVLASPVECWCFGIGRCWHWEQGTATESHLCHRARWDWWACFSIFVSDPFEYIGLVITSKLLGQFPNNPCWWIEGLAHTSKWGLLCHWKSISCKVPSLPAEWAALMWASSSQRLCGWDLRRASECFMWRCWNLYSLLHNYWQFHWPCICYFQPNPKTW